MREPSIFSLTAPALIARGYSPLPILPGSKKPGTDSLMRKWTQWCFEIPPPNFIAGWSSYPDCGVGVCLGRGLICVDIDFEQTVAPLLAILPPAAVGKIGRKGISLFYRGSEAITSRGFKTHKRVGLVDLLAGGRQTVLPPSRHPDTGESYRWWSDDALWELDLEDLTELPDDIADRIGEVLKQFGYDPESERPEYPISESDVSGVSSSLESIYASTNALALANLHAWVPGLYLYKLRSKPGGYEAVATWRPSSTGRPRERRKRSLSIVSAGIVDFGDGPRGYSAVDLVMAARELDKAAALNWLLERLPQEPLILLRK